MSNTAGRKCAGTTQVFLRFLFRRIMKTWTIEETQKLSYLFPITTKDEIEKLFPNKTPLAIYKKANRMGLKREKRFAYKTACQARTKIKYQRNKIKTSKGYILVYCPNHNRANKSGRVLEHILVWENYYNKSVPKGYVVHHINEDKSDNRIENLCLMSSSEHIRHHHIGAKRPLETREKIGQKTKERLSKPENHPLYKNVDILQMQKEIELGDTVINVCKKYGINKTTFYKKIKKGDYKICST